MNTDPLPHVAAMALRYAGLQGGGDGDAFPCGCDFREMDVIPANAATQPFQWERAVEVPAFAGMAGLDFGRLQ